MEVSLDHLNHLVNYIQKYVVPCFPPHYQIYNHLKQTYLAGIYRHLNTHHLPNMDKYMTTPVISEDENNSEILLEFYAFIRTAETQILNEQHDETMQNMYFRLVEYFPIFLDYSEELFKERFGRIIEEQRFQEAEVVRETNEKKLKKQVGQKSALAQVMQKQGMDSNFFETPFVQDVFEFVDQQLESISQCLDQDQLYKFIVLLVTSMCECTHSMIALDADLASQPDDGMEALQCLIIRANDLGNVLDEFDEFKSDCCESYLILQNLSERAKSIFDDKLV